MTTKELKRESSNGYEWFNQTKYISMSAPETADKTPKSMQSISPKKLPQSVQKKDKLLTKLFIWCQTCGRHIGVGRGRERDAEKRRH
jgi:hypothetical protein